MKEFWKNEEFPPGMAGEKTEEKSNEKREENFIGVLDEKEEDPFQKAYEDEEQNGLHTMMKPFPVARAAIAGLLFIVLVFGSIILPVPEETTTDKEASLRTVIPARVEQPGEEEQDDNSINKAADADEDPDESVLPSYDTEGTETSALPSFGTEGAEDQISSDTFLGWYRMIFGGTAVRTPGQQVVLSGLTRSMRQQTGMLEASLIRKMSAFLEAQDLHPKEVKVHDKVLVSGEGALAYEASLTGYDDICLTMIFYPKLAGEYIFLLSRKTGSEPENDGNGDGASGQAEAQQAGQPSQGAQQQTQAEVAESVQPQQATVSAQEQNNAPAVENAYDATKLTIKSVPETLMNYIRNRYDFQYSLYDYLYRNGHRQVKRATVKGYEIDGESRTADIKLRLDDGSTVLATYDRDSNTYTFR